MSWVSGTTPGRSGVKIGEKRDPNAISQTNTQTNYSAGIVLKTRIGKKISDSSAMMGDVAAAFNTKVIASLDQLKTLPTGAQLLAEIDGSGHVLYIISGADNFADGSCVIPYPGDMKTSEERFIKSIRPPAAPKLKKMMKEGMWVNPKQAYTSVLTHALDRAHALNSGLTRAAIAALIGISPAWLQEMEDGTRPIPDTEYYKLCLYLYDVIESGKGCDAEMRVVFTQAKDPDDPLYIIIGHELIHAWRIMKGRRVFETGWEEEAMTTGLPPFANLAFSENKLRVEAGLPVRAGYSARCGTGLINCVRDMGVQPARQDRPFAEKDIVRPNNH